jgi:hypothetical protein
MNMSRANAALLAKQSNTALLDRFHKGGQDMPPRSPGRAGSPGIDVSTRPTAVGVEPAHAEDRRRLREVPHIWLAVTRLSRRQRSAPAMMNHAA